MIVVKCAQFHPKSPLTDPTMHKCRLNPHYFHFYLLSLVTFAQWISMLTTIVGQHVRVQHYDKLDTVTPSGTPQTRGVDQMLFQCWPRACWVGPTLRKHETLRQCSFNVRPSTATLAQH